MYWPVQSSFGIVCNLLDKGFWGGRVDICPMVFHDVVEECVCIFDHKVCAQRSRTRPAQRMTRAWHVPSAPVLGGVPQFQPAPLYGNINGILCFSTLFPSSAWKDSSFDIIINPRCACAARVTVVVPCVCVCS